MKEHPQLVVMIAEGCISLTAAAQLGVQAGSKEAAVSWFISNSSINTSAFKQIKETKEVSKRCKTRHMILRSHNP